MQEMISKGDILNNTYEILGEIGEGGAGIIYLANHLRLQKKVVVKKIKDHYVGVVNERAEADLLKRLHHTYLPQVYDFLQIRQQVFTVMDYIEGRNLSWYLNQHQRFTERQVVLWMRQLCDVLEYLHSQKPPIIHSDIKPANIMITPKGDIRLIDFNISLGDDGSKGISGFSERYAAPEQVWKSQLYLNGGDYRSVTVDERSDIYSLGATLYHMLTGVKPPADYRNMLPLRQLDPPYSEHLLNIVERAIQPDPRKRYQNISDMKSDLLNIKRRDRELRHAVMGQKITAVLGAAMLLVGAAVAYVGVQQVFIEQFDTAYENLTLLAQTDDYERTVSQSVKLLNEQKFENAMKKEPEKKADILYMAANCYFEQDDYGQAAEYYEEAVSYNQTNPEYYRDYAIALAREEETEAAQEILEEAISLGLEEDHIYLVQAEISLAEGDALQAVEEFREAIDRTENEYLRARAYLLCARAYRKTGDYEGEIQILTEAREQVEPSRLRAVVQALGAAYMRKYNQISDPQEKQACAAQAVQCYENLVQGDSTTFQDSMNLAVLYEIQEEYEKAEEILLKMEQQYPDDYRVYMRLALLYCSTEGMKEQADRDYTEAERYFEMAEQFYEKNRNSGESDENMQNLEDIMDQLYEKGWLEKK